ncbi:hypothetical protein WJX75_009475 [Coccomyxa subellipsoidea]|uniref:Glycoside hydrolase n=1 Tax=Coccomyxa subellipsoidea TaxID=248742 RepID=A0ABR2YNB9_9CHLO
MRRMVEGWGQFDTQRMVQLGHELDSSRLWDAASGWIDPQDRTAYPPGGDINKPGPWFYHYTGYVGDLRDDHNYPDAKASDATQTRANVAGEYGGLGTFVDGHTWVDSSDKVFKAYPLMDNTTQFQSEFIKYLHVVKDLMQSSSGLSGAIYTEVTDVEDEVNGLYTYDRQVMKFPDPEAVAKEIKDLLSMQVD